MTEQKKPEEFSFWNKLTLYFPYSESSIKEIIEAVAEEYGSAICQIAQAYWYTGTNVSNQPIWHVSIHYKESKNGLFALQKLEEFCRNQKLVTMTFEKNGCLYTKMLGTEYVYMQPKETNG
jgi:hypothetical protein